MRPTIRFVLITALRDRLFVSLFALLGAVLAGALFLGSGAIFEQAETASVYAGGGIRTVTILGLIVFVAFHVERIHETREIEAILSRAISRSGFVVSYWAGLALIALAICLPVSVLIGLVAPSALGTFYWAISLMLETALILAFAIFASLTIERAVPTVFATVGFYALSRLAVLFTGISAGGKQSGLNQVTNPVIDTLALVVPRLDLFGQSRWLIYGPTAHDNLWVLVLQAGIYIPLLLLASIYDLQKKRF